METVRSSRLASLVGALACACANAPNTPAVTGSAPTEPRAPAVVSIAPAEPTADPSPDPPPVEPDPQLVNLLKSGGELNVWGLTHALQSQEHPEAVRESIMVTGFIVATNLDSAPACAVHAGGIADAYDCTAPVPAFWLGDRPDSELSECVKVMGFAANYAQIYDAIQAMDRGEQAFDAFWGLEIPNPLPAVGAWVTVRGEYGTTFSMTSAGGETNETMGIVTFRSMSTNEPAPELATLPGVKRKPQP